jgi:dimethylargininase
MFVRRAAASAACGASGVAAPALVRSTAAAPVASRARFSAQASAPSTAPAAAGAAASASPLLHWQSGTLAYKRALVRGLAPSFAQSAVRRGGAPSSTNTSSSSIDQSKAEAQHAAYTAALRACLGSGGEVLSIPPAEGCADSVFVEDTAVVVGRTALLTRPGHPSRRGEVAGVGEALRAAGLNVVRLDAPGATLDGGDVLFTGREFFVGLSSRTNSLGVEAVGRAFPGVRVTAVPLRDLARDAPARDRIVRARTGQQEALHLKSLASMLGPDTVAVADTHLGRAVAFFMQDASGVPRAVRRAGGRVSFVLLPDEAAANVVSVNGTVLVQPAALYPASAEVLYGFAAETGARLVEVDTSELAKADGALSCCSILLA